jgi:CRP-like cAMP-binding protein
MLRAETTQSGNHLLNALPAGEYHELQTHLIRVEMPLGKILYDVGEPINYIYFPENSIISTVSFFEDGASIETGITGREGLTGFGVALSDVVAQRETSVQAEGFGWHLPSKTFQNVFERSSAFQHIVLQYIYAYLEQVSQSGACINHHPVNRRLARWLLMCHDRTEGEHLHITHDFIAQMLGLNRPSVTGAAIELKEKGLIKYSRGVVQIVDRPGLEAFSCECYDSIRKVYDHYLSLLEIRRMNRQIDYLNGTMSAEMKRRQLIQKNTHTQIQNLQRVVGDIKNPPVRVRVCRKCQRLCDFRNKPKKHNDLLGRRIDAEFVPVVCSICSQN